MIIESPIRITAGRSGWTSPVAPNARLKNSTKPPTSPVIDPLGADVHGETEDRFSKHALLGDSSRDESAGGHHHTVGPEGPIGTNVESVRSAFDLSFDQVDSCRLHRCIQRSLQAQSRYGRCCGKRLGAGQIE